MKYRILCMINIGSIAVLRIFLFVCLFTQVNITVLDINDNAPMWQEEPYLANVVEMSPINTDVISVSTFR